MLLKCAVVVVFLPYILADYQIVPIGALFDNNDYYYRAFMLAVNVINNSQYDQFANFSDIQILPEAHIVEKDIIDVSRKACELFEVGVAGIFGPQYRLSAEYVQSLCHLNDLPQLVVRWDPRDENLGSINLYPDAEVLSKIFLEIVNLFKWQSFAILYENVDSLNRLHRVLKMDQKGNSNPLIRRLNDYGNYREVFQEIKKIGMKNILIDCSFDILPVVLRHAQQVGVMIENYKYIITSLDFFSLDLEPYRYSGVSITGIRMIDPERLIMQKLIGEHLSWLRIESVNQLRIDQALIFDSVVLFARAYQSLTQDTDISVKQMPCNGSNSWEHGLSLSNYIRGTEIEGLTGHVAVEADGFRRNFKVDVINIKDKNVRHLATWRNETAGLLITRKQLLDDDHTGLSFRVLITLTEPFAMKVKRSQKLEGNAQYEGFAIDLIKELSKRMGFNYTFEVQEDGVNGNKDPKTKEWNGMIRKIINNETDLAITDMTITKERQEDVDFTMPFMNLGISILYRKAKKAPPTLWSFLSPFESSVWLWLLVIYVFVSLLFFCLGRLSPSEWNNPHPCIDNPETLQSQFTLKNSLWFTLGSIAQQGSEIAPIGNSTRMLAGSWFFFCLIMVSSYTANLAACLTVENPVSPVKSIYDLVNQTEIRYGAKKGGATFSFFNGSSDPAHNQLYAYMLEHPEDMMTSNEAGQARVSKENGTYAYLMESSSIEYIQERNCNLEQAGPLLDQKGYGIAMRKNSSYLKALSNNVLRLQEDSTLSILKERWWKERGHGGSCKKQSSSGSLPLSQGHVNGVFLVLVIGCSFSFVATLWEFFWDFFRKPRDDNTKLKTEIVSQFKFITSLDGAPKPAKRHGFSKSNSNDSRAFDFLPIARTSSEEN